MRGSCERSSSCDNFGVGPSNGTLIYLDGFCQLWRKESSSVRLVRHPVYLKVTPMLPGYEEPAVQAQLSQPPQPPYQHQQPSSHEQALIAAYNDPQIATSDDRQHAVTLRPAPPPGPPPPHAQVCDVLRSSVCTFVKQMSHKCDDTSCTVLRAAPNVQRMCDFITRSVS